MNIHTHGRHLCENPGDPTEIDRSTRQKRDIFLGTSSAPVKTAPREASPGIAGILKATSAKLRLCAFDGAEVGTEEYRVYLDFCWFSLGLWHDSDAKRNKDDMQTSADWRTEHGDGRRVMLGRLACDRGGRRAMAADWRCVRAGEERERGQVAGQAAACSSVWDRRASLGIRIVKFDYDEAVRA
ncbi:hypothetical protein B0H14DRAFT_3143078 [Mycena olivaceomarginata]|nr:hypothetical protein B0H14DRAFT_3143078 [Mycena olivaceomarginata]